MLSVLLLLYEYFSLSLLSFSPSIELNLNSTFLNTTQATSLNVKLTSCKRLLSCLGADKASHSHTSVAVFYLNRALNKIHDNITWKNNLKENLPFLFRFHQRPLTELFEDACKFHFSFSILIQRANIETPRRYHMQCYQTAQISPWNETSGTWLKRKEMEKQKREEGKRVEWQGKWQIMTMTAGGVGERMTATVRERWRVLCERENKRKQTKGNVVSLLAPMWVC